MLGRLVDTEKVQHWNSRGHFFGAAGFWLPNDPRGSWSDYGRQWEIARFGRPRKTIDRLSLDELTEDQIRQRDAAKAVLQFPPVSISGQQALTIALGFARQIQTSNYTFCACAILPEHTHIVVARHTYKVERIANLLKGASTTEMIQAGNHPLILHIDHHGRPQRMWSAHQWKVYLDSEVAIEEAISYVEANPEKEGKPRQKWNFVTPFAGVPQGGWTTYH